MKKVNEEQLIIDVKEREKVISKVWVLDKVEGLFLLPSLEMATTKQTAEFFEVDVEAIRKIVHRNEIELIEDGYNFMRGKEIIAEIDRQDNMSSLSIEKTRGGYTLDNQTKIPYVGTGLFPKRAILRVGMLLRDSEVAKEVRTQLLNIEEKAPEEVKTFDTNYQKELAFEQLQAKLVGDWETYEKVEMKIMNHLNKHINKVEYQLEQQKPLFDKMQNLVNSSASLNATEIASSFIWENGEKVKASEINLILSKNGYIESCGNTKKFVTEKGKEIGGIQKKFNNGCMVYYVEWKLASFETLDELFQQYKLQLV